MRRRTGGAGRRRFAERSGGGGDARFGAAPPRFFDPARRLAKPDLAGRTLRILTDDEYPPFGFPAADGSLAGFNVDLARALCETLALSCTIQARRFDTLVDALAQGEGDAAVASLALAPGLTKRVDFTLPYYRTPARFLTRDDGALGEATPAALSGRAVAVEARTAHEDYLRTFFPQAKIKTYVTAAAARAALRTGEVDALFGDGVTLAIWLASGEPQGCCRFLGGPFTESRWFGDGVAIAVRKGDAGLRRGFDWALHRLAQNGVYSEAYLKYFPVGFY
ncbi:MAG: transporter substrate-binding domain-containing protein [Rhodoblastus sp.]|nr:MAG: transporter substrate-binding domain-containing protein [Rhodoblastus sp.]